jgi:hypothetical protein
MVEEQPPAHVAVIHPTAHRSLKKAKKFDLIQVPGHEKGFHLSS